MKKVKRYSAGGYEDTDDYKNLISAQEREDVEAIGDKFSKTLKGYENTDDYKNLISAQEREDVDAIGSKFAKTLKKDKGSEETPKAAPKTQSFGAAFKAARSGGAKTFEWNGKKYTTETAEEKKAKSSAKPSTSATSAAMADGSFAQRQTYKRAIQERQKTERQKASGAGYKKGGSVKSSGHRGDGIAQRGKTKGRMV
jgi:hypothetical protein